jgi:solute carrier family 50 protein (sugar transporter)
VNFVGLACALFYLGTYYCFSAHRQHELFVQALALCSAALLAIMITARSINPYHTVPMLGLISSSFSVALFGSPLVKLYHVVMVTKSAASIPLSQSVLGFLCSSAWAFYGYLLQDWYMITPNLLGSLLSLLQLGIIWAYWTRSVESLLMKPEPSQV